ncbi:MAG: phage/plasmid primase, P4 family [Anaerolineae bacterium]
MTEERTTESNELLEAALAYASKGWAVFPCTVRGKEPLTPHGFRDATTDEATIRAWWERWPQANIGIALGASGLAVVDVDLHKEDGFQTLNQLLNERGEPLPASPRCRTGGGGHHVYFTAKGQRTRKLGPGLELRSEGAYVIAPPSVHPDGPTYLWEKGLGPEDLPVAALPEWLAVETAKGDGHEPHAVAAELPNTIYEGEGRNVALASLAGSMRRRGLSPEEMLPTLREVNSTRCDPPLDEIEVMRIAVSIGRYEPEEPVELGDQDYGNAQVLARRLSGQIRWAHHMGKWVRWTGQVWRSVPDEAIAKLAAEELVAEYTERLAQVAAGDRDTFQDLTRRLRAVQVYGRVVGALSFLKGWPGVLTLSEEWDASPWELNVANGVLDLKTAALRPHSPDDLFLKLAPVDYDPEALGKRWQAHLLLCLPSASIRRHVQRDLGRALVGTTLDETLSIWHGGGKNGKSTTTRALLKVLGDYGDAAAPDLLIESRGDRHPTEKADLAGKRVVFSVEVDEGKRLAEATMKNLTGGEPIKARFMRQDFFTFERTWEITLVVNHKPVIKGTDDAVWRRIRLVPWVVTIPVAERRPQEEVVEALVAEGPAMLRWMLEGLADWQQDHDWVAPEVEAANAAYRAEQDLVSAFFGDCCWLEPDTWDIGEHLRCAYDVWVEGRSDADHKLSNDRWGSALENRGCVSRQVRIEGRKVRTWRGIRFDPVRGGFVVVGERVLELEGIQSASDAPDTPSSPLRNDYPLGGTGTFRGVRGEPVQLGFVSTETDSEGGLA